MSDLLRGVRYGAGVYGHTPLQREKRQGRKGIRYSSLLTSFSIISAFSG